MKRFALFALITLLTASAVWGASFYWVETSAELSGVGAAGDRAITIDNNGVASVYYNDAGSWTVVDNLVATRFVGALTGAVTGNVTGNVTGTVSGNAGTASALAADPADCAAGQVATGIAASGALSCTATPSVTTLTGAVTGNASTATALAADPADCSAGEVATGIAASGALTCTATPTVTSITAANFISTAVDNAHQAAIGNSGPLNDNAMSSGSLWLNGSTNMVNVRNYDNDATLEVFTSGAAHTLNFATTGTLTGGIMILDNTAGPTAAQSYGSLNLVNAAITVTLPTAVAGMATCVMDNGAAHDIIVDVQATDNVILVGVQGAAGVGITNASGSSTGDYVCLVAALANKWYVMGKQGTWASQ